VRPVRGRRKGDSEMKILSRGVLAAVVMLTLAAVIHAQDLSKYRNFSFGASLANVSKQVDRQPIDAEVVHKQPALIEELTWYPPASTDDSVRSAEPVDRVLFSFCNDALYRMLVIYESSAVAGLTDVDMIRVISAKYGVATRPVADVNFPTNPSYRTTEKVIARWEDSQYSINLFRTSYDAFAVVMFDKRLDAQAEVSIAESILIEQLEAPQKEVDRVKKQADDLEGERQKNLKILRP
jgi:hypothetical protein